MVKGGVKSTPLRIGKEMEREAKGKGIGAKRGKGVGEPMGV